jgi:membrane associated rhomboid family serine protease
MHEAPVGFHCPDDAALGRRSVRRKRTSVGAALRDAPPYVTGVLVALNVLVYLVTAAKSAGGLNDPHSARLFLDWQLQPAAVYQQDEYYRLITSAFLHVSLLHIGANMLALAIIGPSLERLLGPWRMIAVYVLAALGGSAAIYAFGNPAQPVVGASGAIFGLFAVSLVMVRRLGLDAQWLIGIIVLNFVFTFSVQDISKLAHIGGFVTGALAALTIAGLPSHRGRMPTPVQASGLVGLLVLIALMIGVRTATGGSTL